MTDKLQEKADKITEGLYLGFGSGEGILFGIPASCRSAVNAIVKLVLESERMSQNE